MAGERGLLWRVSITAQNVVRIIPLPLSLCLDTHRHHHRVRPGLPAQLRRLLCGQGGPRRAVQVEPVRVLHGEVNLKPTPAVTASQLNAPRRAVHAGS